jgi:hypothetical protein
MIIEKKVSKRLWCNAKTKTIKEPEEKEVVTFYEKGSKLPEPRGKEIKSICGHIGENIWMRK